MIEAERFGPGRQRVCEQCVRGAISKSTLRRDLSCYQIFIASRTFTHQDSSWDWFVALAYPIRAILRVLYLIQHNGTPCCMCCCPSLEHQLTVSSELHQVTAVQSHISERLSCHRELPFCTGLDDEILLFLCISDWKHF